MGIQTRSTRRRVMPSAVMLLLTFVAMAGQAAAKEEKPRTREQVGEVFGKPVYRDQIRSEQPENQSGELLQLFSGPARRAYLDKHRKEIEPTDGEIEFARKFFDEEHLRRIQPREADLRRQLKAARDKLQSPSLSEEARKKIEFDIDVLKADLDPPGEMFARFVLDNWKFQKHLYEKYGGGRILWQQAGLEAFDATRVWLESMEKAGDFRISDPVLRASFYEYWTTKNHGAFLTGDKERIRKEFLEPEWAKKPEKNRAT